MTWETVPLGEVVELCYGRALTAENRSGSGYPVVGSGGIVGQHHSALVDGPTVVVGRKGSIGSLTFVPDGCWPIDTAYYTRLKRDVDVRWLYWTMHSLGLNSMNKSAAVPGLSRDDVHRCIVPFPPRPEQRRIAAILDEADRLREQCRMQLAALEGAEDWAFGEIVARRMSNTRVTLDDLADEFRYGTSVKSGPSGLPVLRIPNVTGRDLNIAELKTVELPTAEVDRLRLDERDVLFVRSNGNRDVVGRCSAFMSLDEEKRDGNTWVFASYLIRVRLKAGVEPEAVAALARSRVGRRHLWGGAATSAGQYNINIGVLRSLPAFDPTSPDQHHFGLAVKSMREVRQRLLSRAQRLDELFASLQHRAFRGEL